MWSWFFPKKYTEVDVYNTLQYCKYSSNNACTIRTIKDTLPHYPNIHSKILLGFLTGDILESNIELVRMMMNEWPEILAPVMYKLLENDNILAGMAMGTERSGYNTNYYKLVKNCSNMSLGEFRRKLTSIKELWDVIPRVFPQTREYTICLHNEPLNYKITNRIIYTCYRDIIKMHEYIYDPVETLLNLPLAKPIWNYITQRPLVIITSSIETQMEPPKDVYLVFTESTKSWGPQILPYFNEKGYSVIRNFIDFYETINNINA